jgi:hypothetical protein
VSFLTQDKLVVDILTTRGMADLLGTAEWRVRRLFEDGSLPEPPRFAGKRAIPTTSIPAVVDALRQRGWLSKEAGGPP